MTTTAAVAPQPPAALRARGASATGLSLNPNVLQEHLVGPDGAPLASPSKAWPHPSYGGGQGKGREQRSRGTSEGGTRMGFIPVEGEPIRSAPCSPIAPSPSSDSARPPAVTPVFLQEGFSPPSAQASRPSSWFVPSPILAPISTPSPGASPKRDVPGKGRDAFGGLGILMSQGGAGSPSQAPFASFDRSPRIGVPTYPAYPKPQKRSDPSSRKSSSQGSGSAFEDSPPPPYVERTVAASTQLDPSELQTVPPGPQRTALHRAGLPSSSSTSSATLAQVAASVPLKAFHVLVKPLSFLAAPSSPFADSHARSPPPPANDGAFDGAKSTGYCDAPPRSPPKSSRRTLAPLEIDTMPSLTRMLGGSGGEASPHSGTPMTSTAAFFSSNPYPPIGPTASTGWNLFAIPRSFRRVLAWTMVAVAAWLVITTTSRSVLGPDRSSIAVPSTRTNGKGRPAVHAPGKSGHSRLRKGKEKATRLKMAAAHAAKAAADRARIITGLMPLSGTSRRFRYGANFQPAGDEIGGKVDEGDNTNGLRTKSVDRAKVFEDGRQKYASELEHWKSFEWSAPPVHRTMTEWEDGLKGDEQEVRSVVRAIRDWSSRGIGVGLGAKASDAVVEEKREYADEQDEVEEDEPDSRRRRRSKRSLSPRSRLGKRLPSVDPLDLGPFARLREPMDRPVPQLSSLTNFSLGSLTKWSDLLGEELAAANGLNAQCGSRSAEWMREYAELHRLVSTSEAPGHFLTYICENGMNCGGLGDRLLGMTSAFLFALVTGRVFHAEWQAPIPLDAVFDAPNVDWSFSSFTAPDHPIFGRPELVDQAKELDIIHFNAESTDQVFGTRDWDAPIVNGRLTKGLEARDLAFASPWIKFFTNRGMVYRSFRYKRVRRRLQELELRPHSAFSCILSYLFTPKPSAREFVNAYTSVFSLPSVFAVGIQVRTGDLSMRDPSYDKQNTVEVHKEFFTCADALAETYALPDQKVLYYLVTDSAHLREDALKKMAGRVVVSGLGISHIHQKSGHADGVFHAVIEEWMLAKTDYRVITQDSGFGKLASFAAGKQSTTVTIFPQRNLDVLGLRSKKAHTRVDCRLESAFVTFDELSAEWSLA